MPEVLEQSVLYFSPHSKHEMQNALLEIYNDAELRVKLKKLGVKNSHRFSWKHSAEKINLLLEELEN
jgi:glycosyltransferase involved in cell wall biosynthesis